MNQRLNGSHRQELDPATESDSELAIFIRAMKKYMKNNRRSFPTWSEVLEVARALGYRNILPPVEMPKFKGNAAKKQNS